ncbi:MAG: ABC transporter substrate-binding protein [Pyrinomonadaceae bacterium]
MFFLKAKPRALWAYAAATALLLAGSYAFARQQQQLAQLTAPEKRGKQIYLRGSGNSPKEITALLNEGATEVPAGLLPCAGCHGFDGQGKPEGGLVPSVITWEALTKTYGAAQPNGRTRPAYTESTLKRAITEGVDPVGNKLLAAMPRYRMAREDLDDLTAYLKRLASDRDPGLTENTIKIGTVLPLTGPAAEIGRAVGDVLRAYFDEINRRGGIYQRRLELSVAEASESAAETTVNAKRLIGEEQVFAVTAPFFAKADKELAALAESEGVPVIGPFTLFPAANDPPNRHVFYLLSGLDLQTRSLVDFASQKLRHQQLETRGAAISFEGEMPATVAEALADQSRKNNWHSWLNVSRPRAQFNAAQLAQELQASKTTALFFVGGREAARSLMKEAGKLGWTPHLFLIGSLEGRDVFDFPASFKDKIFLSFPTVPSDQTSEAVLEYRALAERHKLSAKHLAVQFSAYSAAKVLNEGLKLAGRDLTREKLISSLEGLYAYQTGLTPAITYGPNRRVGAAGAYVMAIDADGKTFTPASGWITPR